MKTIFKVLFFMIVGFITIWIAVSIFNGKPKSNLPVDKHFSLPWVEPGYAETEFISRALIKSNILGCGEYYLRRNTAHSNGEYGKYMIGCTRDGINWSYYLISDEIANGPFFDSSITKPNK